MNLERRLVFLATPASLCVVDVASYWTIVITRVNSCLTQSRPKTRIATLLPFSFSLAFRNPFLIRSIIVFVIDCYHRLIAFRLIRYRLWRFDYECTAFSLSVAFGCYLIAIWNRRFISWLEFGQFYWVDGGNAGINQLSTNWRVNTTSHKFE